MDDKSQAELEIIIAAEQLATELLREDKILNFLERKLVEAVFVYKKLLRDSINCGENISHLPKPPNLPKEFIQLEKTTLKYPNNVNRQTTTTDIDKSWTENPK